MFEKICCIFAADFSFGSPLLSINRENFGWLVRTQNGRSQAKVSTKFSLMSKRKPRQPGPPLWYKEDPEDDRQLILRNGTRICQILENVDLYLSQDGHAYSLTKFGLRRLRVSMNKKSRYGLKSCNGVNNGQTYPYVIFRGRTYRIHVYMALAWIGPRPEGHEIDHLNGNIDDWRLCNLQYVTFAENRRRATILRRLRHAAQTLKDPTLDPRNIDPKRLEKIFASLTVGDPAKIMDDDFKHHCEC